MDGKLYFLNRVLRCEGINVMEIQSYTQLMKHKVEIFKEKPKADLPKKYVDQEFVLYFEKLEVAFNFIYKTNPSEPRNFKKYWKAYNKFAEDNCNEILANKSIHRQVLELIGTKEFDLFPPNI